MIQNYSHTYNLDQRTNIRLLNQSEDQPAITECDLIADSGQIDDIQPETPLLNDKVQQHMQQAISSYLKSNLEIDPAITFTPISTTKIETLECKTSAVFHYRSEKEFENFIKENPSLDMLTIIYWPPNKYTGEKFNLSAVTELKHLKNLLITNNSSIYEHAPEQLKEQVLQELFTLPSLPQLESLGIINIIPNDQDEKLSVTLMEHVALQCPNLKGLNVYDIVHFRQYNRLLPGIEKLQNLEELSLPHNIFTDFNQTNFDKLRLLPHLRVLNIPFTCIAADQRDLLMDQIFSIPSLEVVDLSLFNFRDYYTLNFSQLDHSYPNIKSLNLSKNTINNLDAAHLFPHLAQLNLSNCNLTQMQCQDLAKFTQLKELSLANCTVKQENKEQLSWIVMPNLKHLNLSQFSAHGFDISHLAPNLIELNLSQTNITSGDIKNLTPLNQLEKLNISQSKISETSIKFISNLKNMRSLDMSQTILKQADFTPLAQLQQLKEINLDQTTLSVQSFLSLGALTQLETLSIRNLNNDNITPAYVAQLQAALPNTKILF